MIPNVFIRAWLAGCLVTMFLVDHYSKAFWLLLPVLLVVALVLVPICTWRARCSF